MSFTELCLTIGTSNHIDLAVSSNYNLRYDGAGAGDYLSDRALYIADVDNDGRQDILVGALKANNNSRADSGSLYIIYNTLIDDYSGTGNNIDLATSSNYNLRYDGATADDELTWETAVSADINNNDKQDILVGAADTDYNSRSNSGSLYVIYDSLIDDYSGTGNNIDLATSSNYNLRYDGATALCIRGAVNPADMNNNGRRDLLIGAYIENDNAGSLYVIYDSLIDDYSGTGNNIDLATAANYNLRYDGETLNRLTSGSINTADLNSDGKQDLLVGAYLASNNSRSVSGSLYIIYNSLIDDYSGTGNNINLAISSNYNLRYDGATAGDNLSIHAVDAADFDNDGREDILVGASAYSNNNYGWLYVIYNTLIDDYFGTGNNIDLAVSSNYNLRYQGASTTDKFSYGGVNLTDLDGDGGRDILVGTNYSDSNSRTNSGSLYIIYNFPHSFSVNSVSPYTSTNTLSLKGTVSLSSNSVTSLSGVQYNLDSNSPSSGWTNCSGTSSFTCNLSSLSEGGHTVYLRAYDTNTSYTASSVYSSVSFTYDKTAPLTSWTNNEGGGRTFSSAQANVFTTSLHLPSFTFTKAKDTTAGIAKYQILIKKEKQADGSGNQYYTYIDDIPHDPSGAGAGTILDETNRYLKYSGDDIFVYSKRTLDQLPNGGYKWKVRVLDKAGNSTDTEEKILLINTHSANFSGTWFPLVLLSKSPSFYGITTVGSIVTLTLKQNNQVILTKQTTANPQSRFGINLTKSDSLKSGTYTVLLSATNLHLDYIELPEFTFTYGKKTLPTVTAAKTSPSPSITEGLKASPPSESEPTPTPKPRRCFLFWCW